jgi:hypothetical protein
MRWLIHVPVWGDSYFKKFTSEVLPAVVKAMAQCPDNKFRFLAHTDRPELHEILSNLAPAEIREKPVAISTNGIKTKYAKLTYAQDEATDHADEDEKIAYLLADWIPPIDFFANFYGNQKEIDA